MQKKDIDTPALLVDLDMMEKNIRTMAAYFSRREAKLRPHIKSHKTPEIAKQQMAAGAIGITCAKLSEAEAMADAGIENILIANQIVGPIKISRLVDLSRRADVIAAVCGKGNVDELASAAERASVKLNVVLEVEVGMQRCGVPHGEAALDLARHVRGKKTLEFRGIMGYEGHAIGTEDTELRTQMALESSKLLVETAELLRSSKIPVEIVSAGGTGTFDTTGNYPGITEAQVGSYCLMDSSYKKYENVGSAFECAARIVTAVICRPTADTLVIDAGLKAMSTDMGIPKPVTQGIELLEIHEEHLCLKLEDPTLDIRTGDRVEFIPTHTCTTVNLHDRLYALRGEVVEAVWEISARGNYQ